jgi:hypothetical protein
MRENGRDVGGGVGWCEKVICSNVNGLKSEVGENGKFGSERKAPFKGSPARLKKPGLEGKSAEQIELHSVLVITAYICWYILYISNLHLSSNRRTPTLC